MEKFNIGDYYFKTLEGEEVYLNKLPQDKPIVVYDYFESLLSTRYFYVAYPPFKVLKNFLYCGSYENSFNFYMKGNKIKWVKEGELFEAWYMHRLMQRVYRNRESDLWIVSEYDTIKEDLFYGRLPIENVLGDREVMELVISRTKKKNELYNEIIKERTKLNKGRYHIGSDNEFNISVSNKDYSISKKYFNYSICELEEILEIVDGKDEMDSQNNILL